jgi:hypothetical protein
MPFSKVLSKTDRKCVVQPLQNRGSHLTRTINTRWEATQRIVAAKVTILTQR